MPTERAPPQKRRRLPFNPPRPRASPSAGPSTTATKPNKTQKNAKKGTTSSSSKPRTSKSSTRREPSRTPSISPTPESSSRNRNREPEQEQGSESEEEGENSSKGRIREDEADYILAEIKHNNGNHDDEGGSDIHSSTPTVPPKLLTRLLAHNFQDPKTKIAKDANGAVAKYVDVFVREALARAAYERGEGRADGRGGGGIGDGFLEVEDLEKMAPQLVLDF